MGVFDDDAAASDGDVRARLNLRYGIDVQPDAAARDRALARRYGLPQGLVQTYRPDYEAQARMDDAAPVLSQSPKLRDWLAADAGRAEVAHDDLPQLSAVEQAIRVLKGSGGALLSGVNKFNEGAWGVARAGADLLPDVIGRPMAEAFARLGQQERNQAAALMPKADGNLSAGWYSGLQSLGANLVQLPAVIATGGGAGALGMMGAVTGGQSYAQARDQGVGKAEALLFGASQGVIEAGTEKLSIGPLMKLLQPGKFGAKALEYMLKEQGGEQIATALQDLNEWAVLPENQGKTFGDYLAARPDAAIQTAIATAVGGGGQVALMKGLAAVTQRMGGNQARAQQAEQRAELMGKLGELAAASKVLQRDADTFQEFVAQAAGEDGPATDVYIDAQVLQQSGMAEQLAQVSPAVAEQFQAALQTGGDVRIPLAEYATRVAGTPLNQGLLDHLRLQPDDYSRAEAKVFMQQHGEQLQADMARVIEQHATDADWQAGREAVRADFARQLDEVGRWHADANRQYAALLGDYYAATAARAGMTPQELAARYPLRIQAKAGQGATLEQKGAPARDLIVTHNLTSENLLHAKKMGGIAVPSLAVTKKDTPLGEFGEITLVGDANLADPKGYAGTKVFGADIYSPRYPSVEREIDPKAQKALQKRLAPAAEKLGSDGLLSSMDLQRDGQRELERDISVMATFLEERDIAPEIVRKQSELTPERIARLKSFGVTEAHLAATDWFDLYQDEAFSAAAIAEHLDARLVGASPGLRAKLEKFSKNEDVTSGWVKDSARSIVRSNQDTGKVDKFRTQQAIEKQISDAGLAGEYQQFVRDELAKLTKSERIFQGFTNSGNRKYTPHTLENVVKILKKELRGGENLNYGVGSLRAKFTPEFKSLDAIRKAKGRLVSADDFEKVKQEIDAEFSRVGELMGRDLPSDTVVAILEGAPKMGLERSAKDFGATLSTEAKQAAVDFLNKLRDLPTAYFEAKVVREVSPSEFKAAVVPDDVDPAALQYLKDSGITDIRTYSRGDEAGRAAAIGQLDHLFFQDARGQIAFGQDLTQAPSVISLFDGADFSTLIHEAGHFFLEAHMDLAARIAGRIADGEQVSDGERGIVADANALLSWFGVKGDEQAGGAAGGALMQNGAVRPHEVAAQEIADAISKDRESDPFAEYALRVIPGEYTEPIAPGDVLPPSKLWVDGEQTDEDLEGASGAHVKGDDAESVLKALRALGATGKNGPNGFYFGDRVVLIKAERAIPGEDVGEALLPDAEVVGIWRKPSKGLSEVQPNEQSAPTSLGVLSQGGEQPGDRPEPPAIGRTPLDTWALMSIDQKRAYHEQFARGFELYAIEGKAPSLSLQSVFQRFSAWLKNVYRSITQRAADDVLQVRLTDEVRQVMDRMIATDEQIREAEAMREMGPLFGGAEQASMTPEEWTRYHELAAQATAQAADQLQARGLRDMQWLRNAHSRELKRLQARAAELRAEVEMEVRREVLSMPIYRAWQFLTTKGDAADTAQPTPRVKASGALDNTRDNLFTAIAKLGGLDRAEVVGAWGIDLKDPLESGVFGTPVLRKEGGLSIDAMAERLVEEGYLLPDENGRADVSDLETAFDSQRRGVDQFSTWHDYAERAKAAQGEVAPEALPDEILHGKLNTEVLRDMYGTQPEALWRTLSTRRMTSEANGIHPEVVADTFGFDSGDALVRALVAADPPRQVIDGMTDQRMLERYGDLATPEGLQREADKAIHNEARARAIATELDALEKMGKVRETAGARRTADVLAKAARDYALAVIGAKKVRDIRPSEYTAAEARASKAAQKAFKAGDTQAAAAEKRNQLIQNAAARAALQAREEVEKAVEYLRRMEKRPNGLDAGYADQIDQLLERFDLKAVSNKELDKRTGLAAWVESQREQGMEPDIAPELLNEAARTNWRNLTLDELRGLRDAVKQIEHLGRLKGKLLASKAKREFAAVRDELADSIKANAQGRTADTRTPATVLGRRLAALKRFGALHIKAATWARIFDGGKDGGPVWEYLIRGANVAGDFETARRTQATEALTKILAPALKSSKLHRKAHYDSIGRSLTREQVLCIALNTGNEGNWQRLLDGEGWTRPQVAGVLNTLTADEWRAVQGVWDHMESYRPEIGAKEKRVYGKEPEWVEPVSFMVDTADGQRLTLRGGYFPIKYDPAANARTESHADAEDAKRQMQGAYTSATTRRGFTKSRVNEVKGRPLMYSLSAVYSGVQDVIHDLAWHEWLIDTNKLLRSDKVDSAIRQHYGPEVVRQIKDWVKDNAAGDRPVQAGIDEALSRVRRGVSMAGLGFNVMSAAMQPLGITQSIVRIGTPWVARGVAQYVANPFAAARQVNEASAFMAGRSRTRFRELNELRNQVEGESGAMQWMNRNAFWLMTRCQQAVDVPTWLGAHEKAIAEGADEERAVALADQAVIDAQGSGQVKDQAGIEKGGPAQKLFTVFYSFMNTALNLGVSQGMTADTPAKRGKLAVDALLLYTVPVVLGAALKAAIIPGDSGDWDDPEEIAKKLAAAQLDYLMGLFALVRETAEAVKTVAGLGDKPRDYSGPAGLRVIPDLGAFAKQAAQGEFDDAFRKAAVNLTGDLLGLPAAQANRTITGAKALADNETSNPAALVFGFQKER